MLFIQIFISPHFEIPTLFMNSYLTYKYVCLWSFNTPIFTAKVSSHSVYFNATTTTSNNNPLELCVCVFGRLFCQRAWSCFAPACPFLYSCCTLLSFLVSAADDYSPLVGTCEPSWRQDWAKWVACTSWPDH